MPFLVYYNHHNTLDEGKTILLNDKSQHYHLSTKGSHVLVNGTMPKLEWVFWTPQNFFKFSGLKVEMFLCTKWAKLDNFCDFEYTKNNLNLLILQAWRISGF